MNVVAGHKTEAGLEAHAFLGYISEGRSARCHLYTSSTIGPDGSVQLQTPTKMDVRVDFPDGTYQTLQVL